MRTLDGREYVLNEVYDEAKDCSLTMKVIGVRLVIRGTM